MMNFLCAQFKIKGFLKILFFTIKKEENFWIFLYIFIFSFYFHFYHLYLNFFIFFLLFCYFCLALTREVCLSVTQSFRLMAFILELFFIHEHHYHHLYYHYHNEVVVRITCYDFRHFYLWMSNEGCTNVEWCSCFLYGGGHSSSNAWNMKICSFLDNLVFV